MKADSTNIPFIIASHIREHLRGSVINHVKRVKDSNGSLSYIAEVEFKNDKHWLLYDHRGLLVTRHTEPFYLYEVKEGETIEEMDFSKSH